MNLIPKVILLKIFVEATSDKEPNMRAKILKSAAFIHNLAALN